MREIGWRHFGQAVCLIVKIALSARQESTVGGIVQIFCLLPYTIVACILQTTFDTSLARALVAYKISFNVSSVRFEQTNRKLNARVDKQSTPVALSSFAVARDLLN